MLQRQAVFDVIASFAGVTEDRKGNVAVDVATGKYINTLLCCDAAKLTLD